MIKSFRKLLSLIKENKTQMRSLERSRLLLYRIWYKWSYQPTRLPLSWSKALRDSSHLVSKNVLLQRTFFKIKIKLNFFHIISNTCSNISNLYFCVNKRCQKLILYSNSIGFLPIQIIYQKLQWIIK